MKKTILTLLIILSAMCSCTRKDSYSERKRKELLRYEELMSSQNKQLVEDFKLGNLAPSNSTIDVIDGGFYCMWNRRGVEIGPHLALNDLFKENGYKVTLNSDSLRYIIVSETKSHIVGIYSNQAEAAQLETIICVIDMQEQKAFHLLNHMGGMPPGTTKNKRVAIGSYWSDDDIYRNVKEKIKK